MRTDRLSRKILALLLALLTLLPLVSCSKATPDETAAPTGAETTAEITAAETTTVETTAAEPAKYTVRLNAPSNTAIHTDLQASYLADPDPLSVRNYLRPAYTAQSASYDDNPGTIEFGHPTTVTLSWAVETALSESDLRAFTLRIWRGSHAGRATIMESFSKTTKSYVLSNLMIGETYFWSVTAIDADGVSYPSELASFQTDAQGPRNLTVDGVTNVRDLGGWATADGGRVRQGLMFRGSKLVANNSKTNVLVTQAGIKTLRDEFGIKTEIDLRLKSKLGGLTASPLGQTVAFYNCPMDDDASLFFTADNNLQSIRDVFAILADEANYPIYFHCSIGSDRTGMIAWMVNALCGVSEENLWRDYLFSNFGQIGGTRTRSNNESAYVNRIKAKDGDTFAEKTYNFLKDYVGVSESDLQSVIRIMKEAPTE